MSPACPDKVLAFLQVVAKSVSTRRASEGQPRPEETVKGSPVTGEFSKRQALSRYNQMNTVGTWQGFQAPGKG